MSLAWRMVASADSLRRRCNGAGAEAVRAHRRTNSSIRARTSTVLLMFSIEDTKGNSPDTVDTQKHIQILNKDNRLLLSHFINTSIPPLNLNHLV